MVERSVAIRLGTEGKAQVRSDFAEVKADGVGAMDAIGAAADKAATTSDRAAQRQVDTWKRQAAAAKVAAVAGANQTAFNDVLGVGGGSGKSAADSASVFESVRKGEEDATNAAAKLRAAIDPLWSAQQRYDAELRTANSLLAQGAISETEHGAAVALSERSLQDAKRALDQHSNSLGFNRTQFIVAEGAAHRFVDSILAGQSPLRAATMQAGDFANILQMDDGGVAGGLAKVRALISPVTVGIAAGAVVVAAGALAWLDYRNSIDKVAQISQGLGAAAGMTTEQLQQSASAAAAVGDISLASAQQTEQAFLATGQISGDVLVKLTALTRDYSAAMGVDAKAGAEQLATAFADPAQGAEQLTARMGLLDQATLAYVRSLVEQGRQTEAQLVLFNALKGQVDGAAEHINGLARVWRNVKQWADSAAQAMGAAVDLVPNFETKLDRFMRPNFYAAQADAARGDADARKRNAQIGAGASIADSFTGADQLGGYRDAAGKLRAALSNPMPADQRRGLTEALDAYSHAIDTFIPKQEKANQLNELDAKIAAAKTPTQKAALTAQRALVSAQGEVITKTQAEADAHSKGAAALATASKAGAGHAATLARDAASMDVAAKASLTLADAYLSGGSAALIAEARRKALTDATKKGIDTEAQVARQLNLDVAEGVANGAKSVAQLRDETAARQAVLDKVAAGTLSAAQMNDELAKEAELRPLLKLQAVAHGEALAALTRVIQALTGAQDENQRSTRRMADETAHAASVEAIARAHDEAELAGDRSGKASVELAQRAAQRDVDAGKHGSGYVQDQVDVAQANVETDREKYLRQTLNSQQDSIEYSKVDLSLSGASADKRELILNRLKAEQDIRSRFPGMAEADVQQLLAGVDAQTKLNAVLRQAQAGMQELRDVGGDMIDKIFDPSNWHNFGDLGKMVLKEIEAEFIKLAAINPLKNLLGIGGGGLPTLAGLFSGGGGANAYGVAGDNIYASGTEYASGGMSYVGEHGPELVDLPRGARVTPAGQTQRMLANDNQPSTLHIKIDADEGITARIVSIAGPMIQQAGVAAAAQGSSDARDRLAKQQRRRLY